MSLEADLRALYTAGRVDFPNQSTLVSEQCTALRSVIDTVNRAAAQEGDSMVLQHALSVLDEVHDALRQSVNTLNDCAVGLVNIADDYVATDAEAKATYDRIKGDLAAGSAPLPTVPEDNGNPETPGEGSDTESTPEPETPSEDRGERDAELEDNAPEVAEVPS